MIYIPKNKRRVLFEKVDGKEDMFLFLVEDLEEKIDKVNYPNSVFFFKKGKYSKDSL